MSGKKKATKAPEPPRAESSLSHVTSLSSLSCGSDTVKIKAEETMTVNEVLAFCCPEGYQHSSTTNRLYLLADHGPLWDLHSYLSCLCPECQKTVSGLRKEDELAKSFFKGEIFPGKQLVETWSFLCEKCQKHLLNDRHIRSGFKAKFIVNSLQVNEMAKQVEREDILSAYHRNDGSLSLSEQNQFLETVKQEPSAKDALKKLKKQEIVDCFCGYIPTDDAEALDFPITYNNARNAINGHRAQRVHALSLMYAEVTPKKGHKKAAPRPKPVAHAPRVGKLPGNVKVGREIRESYSNKEDQRLMHSHGSEVAGLGDQGAGLKQNIRLLRNLNRETHAWNNQF